MTTLVHQIVSVERGVRTFDATVTKYVCACAEETSERLKMKRHIEEANRAAPAPAEEKQP